MHPRRISHVPSSNGNGHSRRATNGEIPQSRLRTVLPPKKRQQGKSLFTRIKELLRERSVTPQGKYNTRFDDVANAFVKSMEDGSFVHLKEFIDRDEGKIPNRHANADGSNIKAYIAMPVDGDESP